MRAKFLGSDVLLCFISICKFGSFKNPFATITSLSELYFRFRRFILFVQTKKVISMNYGSSASSWKPWRWVRLDLILLMRDIYINSNVDPLTKFTSSSRGTEFKDIIPRNTPRTVVPISTRMVISSVMKRDISFDRKLMETETTTIRISQWRERHCRKNTSVRRKK